MQMTPMYRFFDIFGNLLYVGVAKDPIFRLKQHSEDKPWFVDVSGVTIEWFDSREIALLKEATAILHEKPKYNITGNPKMNRIQLEHNNGSHAAMLGAAIEFSKLIPDDIRAFCTMPISLKSNYSFFTEINGTVLIWKEYYPYKNGNRVKIEVKNDDEVVYQDSVDKHHNYVTADVMRLRYDTYINVCLVYPGIERWEPLN